MGSVNSSVFSLEVAEHLSAERADGLVAELCGFADVVVFSAAIPGQLGTGHVHLAPQSVWANRFANNGSKPAGVRGE